VKYIEQPVIFSCDQRRLIGIVCLPERTADTAVLIVTGGPQYRAGSHRQFTLLARQLAEQGIASLRFDYRGMGDSEGEMRTFEQVHEDLSAASDTLIQRIPEVLHVVIWGLCDAASAALHYAHTDPRISGLVLLNPWVHTPSGAARIRLKHYYLTRLMQASFWKKLLSGNVAVRQSAGDLTASIQRVTATNIDDQGDYIERMLTGLQQFQGRVLIVLSGNDLVAKEFISLTRQDARWQKACGRPYIRQQHIAEANHTFSSQQWRNQVATLTVQWLTQQ
jgi:exosortase A-associated hydrolase 1